MVNSNSIKVLQCAKYCSQTRREGMGAEEEGSRLPQG